MKRAPKSPRKFSRRKAKPNLIKDQDNDSQRLDKQTDEKKHQEMIKRKYRTIDALGCFIISIIIGYAPQYIETNNALVVNVSQLGSFLFLMIGFCIIYWYHPNLPDYKYVWISMPIIAIVLYLAAELWVVPNEPNEPLSTRKYLRLVSFIALLATILMLILKFPSFLDLYEKNKGNIKALFNVKNILGFILGVLTMGTALFQFLQVLLSFFHH